MNISALNNTPLYFANKITEGRDENGSSLNNKEGLSFSQIINQKIEDANSLQKGADEITEKFMAGEPIEIHQMLIAMEKADLALRETVEIRNKLIDAYKEIERMQI